MLVVLLLTPVLKSVPICVACLWDVGGMNVVLVLFIIVSKYNLFVVSTL